MLFSYCWRFNRYIDAQSIQAISFVNIMGARAICDQLNFRFIDIIYIIINIPVLHIVYFYILFIFLLRDQIFCVTLGSKKERK